MATPAWALALVCAVSLGFAAKALIDPFGAFLLLLPLTAFTHAVNLPLVGERITPFDALLVIWWIAMGLRRLAGRRDLHLSPVVIALALAYWGFLVAAVLSLLHAPAPIKGAVEIAVYAFSGLWAFTVVAMASSEDRIERIARWMVWVLVGVCLVSVAEAILGPRGWFPTCGAGIRLCGPFRQTNQLAAYLRTTMPVVWGILTLRAAARWEKWVVAGLTVVGLAVLALTSSRANILVAGVEMALFVGLVLWLRRRVSFRVFWRPVVAVCVVVPLAALLVPLLAPRYWSTFLWRALPFFEGLLAGGKDLLSSLPTPSQVEFAVHNWSMAWEAFLDSPVWGVGIGNFAQQYQIISGQNLEVHSLYLGVLAETGILGLTAVLVLLALLAACGRRLITEAQAPAWLTVGLLVSFAGSLLAGVYIPFLRRREFWLMTGLLLAQYNLSFRCAAAETRVGRGTQGLVVDRQ